MDDGSAWACYRVTRGDNIIEQTDRNGDTYGLFSLDDTAPRPVATIAPTAQAPRASDETLNRVYSAMFDALSLTKLHRDDLHKRGLSDDAIARHGLKSMGMDERRKITEFITNAFPDVDLCTVPGFYRKDKHLRLGGMSGLWVPVRNLSGQTVGVRIRLDEPDSSDNRHQFLSSNSYNGPGPQLQTHVPVWSGNTDCIRITEGELKAIVATELSQTLTLGIPGVSNCHNHAADCLRKLGAKRALVAFDADKDTKYNVSASLERLVKHLESTGIYVSVEHWELQHGKGIDDVYALNNQGKIKVIDDVYALNNQGKIKVIETLTKRETKTMSTNTKTTGATVLSVSGKTQEKQPTANDWKTGLTYTKTGELKNTLHNVCEILRHDPSYSGRLSYNEMTKRHCLDKEPVITDQITQIREQVEIGYQIAPGTENAVRAFDAVAFERKFHPVRDYLESLPLWDGVRRWEQLPKVAIPSNGVLDAVYWLKWGVSMIARAMKPGCKSDNALILSGQQGARKSTALKMLVGSDWFHDSSADIEAQKWIQEFHSKWLIEWAELEQVTTKKGADVVKAFLSKQQDDYRPPYAVKSETWQRGFNVAGTTNREEFLVDPTGNRRFWVIRVTAMVDTNLLEQWRNLLWSEALHHYRNGELWWLNEEQAITQARANADYEERDVWEETIRRWILRNPDDFYTTEQILNGALEKSAKERTKADKNRVETVMLRLGWRRDRKRVDNSRPWGWTKSGPVDQKWTEDST